jgi:hypothetical protein
MTRAAAIFLLLLAAPAMARAQKFWLKDGHSYSAPPGKLDGRTLVLLSGVRVPVTEAVRLEWPEPAAFGQAETMLRHGQAEEAFTLMDATIKAQEPFREIPGSWWNVGAALRARALAALGRLAEADNTVAVLRRSKLESAPAIADRLECDLLDRLLADGRLAEVRARLAARPAEPPSDAVAARVSVIQGHLLKTEGRPEAALFAYLRVPVYFAKETAALPAALLGSARCYRLLGEDIRAKRTLEELVARFPGSAEAGEAEQELAATEAATVPIGSKNLP